MTLPDGTVVAADDGPRPGATLERSRQLQPVFRPDGTRHRRQLLPAQRRRGRRRRHEPTRKAAELGLTPLARIVATGVSALSPEIMGLGPVEASRQALARAGMTIGDIDLVEINEAFAAQVIPVGRRPRASTTTGSTCTAARSRSAIRSA